MWNSREYYLHELSELINLDKTWMGECRYTLAMSCYARIIRYRASDYFYFMLKLKGNATYAFPSWNTVIITIVDMLFVKIKAILRL